MLIIITILCQTFTVNHLPCFLSGSDYIEVKKVDSLAYFATGRGLEIFNLNPPTPTRLSKFAAESPALGIDIEGNYAYLACNYKGICIVDVSNPFEPKLISYFDTEGQAKTIKVRDKFAYIADWENGFLILDISNPSKPRIVAHCPDIGQAYSITLKDTLAFVGSFNRSLKIINISNPRKPVVLSEFPDGENVYGADAYVDDTLAYINCGFFRDNNHYHFAVVNIKNPEKPILIAGLTMPATNVGIVKYQDYIFTNAQDDGIYMVDVSNPTQPTIKGVYNQGHEWGRNLALYEDNLIIPQLNEGFSILKIKKPQEPEEIYKYQSIKWQYLTYKDRSDYAYIIGNIMEKGIYTKSILKIIDIEDPNRPLLTCANIRLTGMGIIYEGSIDYPYLAITLHQGHPAHESLSTLIVNVKKPCIPQRIRTIKGGGPTEFRYPYLYVLDKSKIKITDVEDSNSRTDSLILNRELYDLKLVDSLAYITGKDSLYILNIKTGNFIGSCYHGKSYAINISYNYPYVAVPYTPYPGSSYGFCLFNISNPNEPQLIFDTLLTEIPVNPQCITIMGCELKDSLLCLGRGDYGFDIWKINGSDSPYRIATQETPNNATHCFPPGNSNIIMKNGVIFLIDGGSLEVYKSSLNKFDTK